MYVSNNPLKYVDPAGLLKLKAEEIAKIHLLFGKGENALIDYKTVRIKIGGFHWARLLCIGDTDAVVYNENTIYFESKEVFSASLLVHELTHIWQLRSGANTKGEAAGANVAAFVISKILPNFVPDVPFKKQIADPFAGVNVYDYDPAGEKPFSEYGIEQQAEILRDAYSILRVRNGKLVAFTATQMWYLRRVKEFHRWAKELSN